MSALAPEPPPFVVLDDAVVEARRALPPAVLAYVEGGAEDERTLEENRRAFTCAPVTRTPRSKSRS